VTLARVLQWTQRLLFAAALPALAYVALVLADGWWYQEIESEHLDQARVSAIDVPDDGLVGRLAIPRLGVSLMVAEGGDTRTLRRGAGHIPGTALPGQPGNAGISAHRDTFFRPLRNIRMDDVILVTTPKRELRCRVVATKVVSPTDVEVLNPSPHEILTLVTCYPFYFVGPAPSRFVVRAERVREVLHERKL
jgi:sortase A